MPFQRQVAPNYVILFLFLFSAFLVMDKSCKLSFKTGGRVVDFRFVPCTCANSNPNYPTTYPILHLIILISVCNSFKLQSAIII